MTFQGEISFEFSILNPVSRANAIYQVPYRYSGHTHTWREAKCEVCELGYILILGKGSIIHLKQGFNWALEKGNNPALKSSSFALPRVQSVGMD